MTDRERKQLYRIFVPAAAFLVVLVAISALDAL